MVEKGEIIMVTMFSNGKSVVLTDSFDSIIFVGSEENAKEFAERNSVKVIDRREPGKAGFGN
jgi:hypothetical protein